jgi:hypothetical protein
VGQARSSGSIVSSAQSSWQALNSWRLILLHYQRREESLVTDQSKIVEAQVEMWNRTVCRRGHFWSKSLPLTPRAHQRRSLVPASRPSHLLTINFPCLGR